LLLLSPVLPSMPHATCQMDCLLVAGVGAGAGGRNRDSARQHAALRPSAFERRERAHHMYVVVCAKRRSFAKGRVARCSCRYALTRRSSRLLCVLSAGIMSRVPACTAAAQRLPPWVVGGRSKRSGSRLSSSSTSAQARSLLAAGEQLQHVQVSYDAPRGVEVAVRKALLLHVRSRSHMYVRYAEEATWSSLCRCSASRHHHDRCQCHLPPKSSIAFDSPRVETVPHSAKSSPFEYAPPLALSKRVHHTLDRLPPWALGGASCLAARLAPRYTCGISAPLTGLSAPLPGRWTPRASTRQFPIWLVFPHPPRSDVHLHPHTPTRSHNHTHSHSVLPGALSAEVPDVRVSCCSATLL
jgi:hypothetical protein